MTLPVNSYVVFGLERAPEVHLIDDRAAALMADREQVSNRSKALIATFGIGAECALPAWSLECMERIALEYEGPHERILKGICAAIALGEPFGPSDDSGGTYIEQIKPLIPPRGPASAKRDQNEEVKSSRPHRTGRSRKDRAVHTVA